MRALKALVIGMGVLIVAGLGVVVYAVVDRLGAPEETAAAPPATPEAQRTAASKTLRNLHITLPAGTQIVSTSLGDGQLLLRLRNAEGMETLEIFDTETGRRLRRIAIDRAQ
jgi:hypothetical protein